MQFETIFSIPMSDLIFKTNWQIDNHDGLKWAFFNAHTTTNAQSL
jgi:hypothetical protein